MGGVGNAFFFRQLRCDVDSPIIPLVYSKCTYIRYDSDWSGHSIRIFRKISKLIYVIDFAVNLRPMKNSVVKVDFVLHHEVACNSNETDGVANVFRNNVAYGTTPSAYIGDTIAPRRLPFRN